MVVLQYFIDKSRIKLNQIKSKYEAEHRFLVLMNWVGVQIMWLNILKWNTYITYPLSVDRCTSYNASGLITEGCTKSASTALSTPLTKVPHLSLRGTTLPRGLSPKFWTLHRERRGCNLCVWPSTSDCSASINIGRYKWQLFQYPQSTTHQPESKSEPNCRTPESLAILWPPRNYPP